jgi:VIT1/CCC1 family predicted Fe2+/Mn2+ transporter
VSRRVLDPLERWSEILFGLIMVLTFTSSLSVSEAGRADVRSVLGAAISCNLAWGLVDAVMYAMGSFMERARALKIYRAIVGASDPAIAHRLVRGALPGPVADVATPDEIDSVWRRVARHGTPADGPRLEAADLAGAAGVFLLVFLSTFPVVVPFLVLDEPRAALRTSNAVAVVMLFAAGWSLGRHAGRSAWATGLGTVAVGLALVAITMALGG